MTLGERIKTCRQQAGQNVGEDIGKFIYNIKH